MKKFNAIIFIVLLAILLVAILVLVPLEGTVQGLILFVGLSAIALVSKYLYNNWNSKT